MGNSTNEYGYSSETNAEMVVGDANLNGRHFFVTGCNTGIGFETSRVLYNAGATVTMACRNRRKMEKAKEAIEKEDCILKVDGGSVRTLLLDLQSLEKVRECVGNYQVDFENQKIDCLILNAGVMDVGKGISEDGFEIHMAINHFGHALLAFLFLPLMNDKEGNRIVIVSSKAHRFGSISFNDMQFRKRDYSGFKAYAQSKLANISFAKELNKRLKEKDKKIEVMSLHPGVVKTELGRDSFRMKLFYKLASVFCKSVSQGASTTVFCALDSRITGLGGSYFSDCGREAIKPGCLSEGINKRLFKVTEDRIGMKFPFDGEEVGEREGELLIEQEREVKEEEEEEGEGEEEQERTEQVILVEEKEGSEEEEGEKVVISREEEVEVEEEEEAEKQGEIGIFDVSEEKKKSEEGEVEGESGQPKEKKKEEEEESEDEGEDEMDGIVDEAASPRKKGEEEDEEDD